MPRPRKRDDNDADEVDGGTTSGAPSNGGAPSVKRQRVSLACDACRSAREKCDGGKPDCGPCTSQKRQCSYTPASKKRGVQTGYLRTVELSLAWVLENVPESERALNSFLTENRGSAVQLLSGKGTAGSRLHKRLTNGRVHKGIAALLTDPPPASDLAQADDSDGDAAGSANSKATLDAPLSHLDTMPPNQAAVNDPYLKTQRPIENSTPHRKLPEDWRNLVATHFAHAHEWLPIVSRDAIIKVADSYPPQGVPETEASADDALLWAVLALSAHQITRSGTLTPKQIFTTARSMTPSEDQPFDQPHVAALLLHGLLLIGQGSPLAACLIISKASRIALQIHAANNLRHQAESVEARSQSPCARLLAACSVMDTWGALYVGQPSVLSVELNEKLRNTLSMDPWMLSTATKKIFEKSQSSVGEQAEAEHLATLYQLHTFGCLVRECLRIRSFPGTAISMQRQITSEDLVHSLDPQFSYCNSLVHANGSGTSTPLKSSAFLLQVAFLAATVIVTPHCRPSLLSSVFEAAETAMTRFGVSSTPPLMVALLGVVKDRGTHINPQEERQRWQSTISLLQRSWSGTATALFPSSSNGQPQANQQLQLPPIPRPSAVSTPIQAPSRTPTDQPHMSSGFDVPAYNASPDAPRTHNNIDQGFTAYKASPAALSATSGGSEAIASNAMPEYAPLPAHGLTAAPTANNALYSHGGGQGIDYEAIMQELGSIEYSTDLGQHSTNGDPQFMTNLGFAPDYDLGEMFQGYHAG